MAIAAVAIEPVRPTPTVPSPRYNDVMTPVVFGDEAGVRESIAFGHYVDYRDSNGLTPLIVAAMRRDLAAARLLLDGGANPRLVGGRGQSAMSIARTNGDAGMVALLRRYGVPD
jgi:RNA polymerase primary sigma factor